MTSCSLLPTQHLPTTPAGSPQPLCGHGHGHGHSLTTYPGTPAPVHLCTSGPCSWDDACCGKRAVGWAGTPRHGQGGSRRWGAGHHGVLEGVGSGSPSPPGPGPAVMWGGCWRGGCPLPHGRAGLGARAMLPSPMRCLSPISTPQAWPPAAAPLQLPGSPWRAPPLPCCPPAVTCTPLPACCPDPR